MTEGGQSRGRRGGEETKGQAIAIGPMILASWVAVPSAPQQKCGDREETSQRANYLPPHPVGRIELAEG